MVEDDLLGVGSAVHVREVAMIIGVGMPFKLQACHIDMEGHKVYRYCMPVHMPPGFRAREQILLHTYMCTRLHVLTGDNEAWAR